MTSLHRSDGVESAHFEMDQRAPKALCASKSTRGHNEYDSTDLEHLAATCSMPVDTFKYLMTSISLTNVHTSHAISHRATNKLSKSATKRTHLATQQGEAVASDNAYSAL